MFAFPKSVLIENKVLTTGSTAGKMAFRVYPPWCELSSKQATKSQFWQVKYFIEGEDIVIKF